MSEQASTTTPDPRHWTTTDGHTYTSIPTTVPVMWDLVRGHEHLTYESEAYSITRKPYGKSRWTYEVYRDGIPVSALNFYSLLKDAKARAVRNAEGLDRRIVA